MSWCASRGSASAAREVSAAYCRAAPGDPLHGPYHDTEYGFPAEDEAVLFERLVLEINQAGLSWRTILQKREAFRAAFADFDVDRVASFGPADVERLLADPGIIRNRLKIWSVRDNARTALDVIAEHGSLSTYLWSFVDGKPIVNRWEDMKQVPAKTELSDRMSKALAKRGFRFVGSTICYAFMQATGMVNDHLVSCFRHEESGHAEH